MRKYLLTEDFHEVGDDEYTKSFAKAIQKMESGDVLQVGKGLYKTGPITINKDGITIVLEKDAVISFIADERLYPPIYSRWEGVMCFCMHPCLYVVGCAHVVLAGEGTLSGNGEYWWDQASFKRREQDGPVTEIEKQLAILNPNYENQPSGGGGRQSQFLRPPLLQIQNCNDVRIEGITIKDSPFWTVHPLFSSHLKIQGVSIINPKDAPNTDGIDIDSCFDVEISSCHVDVGDDGIALKSGSGPDGIKVNKPTKDVVIRNCSVYSAHGGTVIGSETAAGIFDVKVSNCLFDGTDRGVRIKTRRGRGGAIEGLSFKHIVMHHVLCPITLNMYYICGCKDPRVFSLEKEPVDEATPFIRNVEIEDILADGIRSSCAFIVGLPESPIMNLSIKHCHFLLDTKNPASINVSEMTQGLPEITDRGIRLRNVYVTLEDVQGAGLIRESGVVLI